MVKKIFKHLKKDIGVEDKNGNTALHYAAFARNTTMVNLLIKEANFSCNLQNKFGITPLMMSLFSFDESKDHTPGLERLLLA